MIARYFDGEVPYPSPSERTPADEAIETLAARTIAEFHAQFEQFQFSRALETAWGLVAAVNKYIVENEPWAVAEREDSDSKARLATILHTAVEALRIVTALVHPVIPEATARIWSQLGLGDIQKMDLRQLAWGQIQAGTKLGKVEPVFPRADKSMIGRMQEMEQERSKGVVSTTEAESGAADAKKSAEAGASKPTLSPTEGDKGGTPTATAPTPATAGAPLMPSVGMTGTSSGTDKITIDDFLKVELRVGQVKVAEKVKGADKLLRMEVDLGTETRQIVAGIAKAYDPEKLVGRKVVIVANLQPRKLRGLESNGMIVAASLEDGLPVLAGFLEDVPVGAKLK